MRRLSLLVVIALAAVGLGACQTGVKMWNPCSPAADGNPGGIEGQYILWCRGGEWQPIVTVQEYLALRRGEHPTIAPLPQRLVDCTTRGEGVDLHGCDLGRDDLSGADGVVQSTPCT